MGNNKPNEAGEQILDSVLKAVESGDFTDLSRNVEMIVSDVADGLSKGMTNLGRELERQANNRHRQIYEERMSRPNVNPAGSWDPKTSAQARPNVYSQQSGHAQTKRVLPVPAIYRKHLPGQASGPVCMGFGVVGTTMMGLAAAITGITVVAGVPIAVPIGLGLGTIPFIGLVAAGKKINGRNRRFRDYVQVIGNKGYCRLEDLANYIGKKKEFVLADVKDMLNKGYFLQGHLDSRQTTLIVSNEAFALYQQSEEERLLREKEAAANAAIEQKNKSYSKEVQAIIDEGEAYIRHIHECNDAIPGEEITAKLAKLENIMQRIFEQVKKQPESADDLHKFMTYYLPTTTKLVDAYRDLDGQPEYGSNIAKTKKEIEDTLDTINAAFEKLFDSMFEDTAWDISSDISTMKVMLQQEGLTGGDDFSS